MDDMIDTAGTLVKAAEVLKSVALRRCTPTARTHFLGPCHQNASKGSALDEIVVTNTIP